MAFVLCAIVFIFIFIPYMVRNASDVIIENRDTQRRKQRAEEWEEKVLDREYESSITPRKQHTFRDFGAYVKYRAEVVDPRKKEAFAYVTEAMEKMYPNLHERVEVKFWDDDDYVRILMAKKGKLRSVDSGSFGIDGSLDDYRRYFVEWVDKQLREHGIDETLCFRTYGTQWGGGIFAKSAWSQVPDVWRPKGFFVWAPGVYSPEDIIR